MPADYTTSTFTCTLHCKKGNLNKRTINKGHTILKNPHYKQMW